MLLRQARRGGWAAWLQAVRWWRRVQWVLAAPATRLPAYLLNGLSVGAGLVLIGAGLSLLAGVPAAMAAAAGAAATSVADTVVPRQAKLAQMLPAWVSSSLVALAVQLAAPHPWALAAVVLVVTFASVLWQAWGKRGGPQTFVMVMALVFQMAAHAGWMGGHDGWPRAGWAVAGSGLFVLWSLASARLLQPRYRRLAVVDAIDAVAGLLRAQARWAGALGRLAGCDDDTPPAPRGPAWRRWPDWSPTLPWQEPGRDPAAEADAALLEIVRRQAAMAEPLQQARDLVYSVRGDGPLPRLSAVLVRVIDMRDQALACQLDLDLLPRSAVGCAALPHAQRLLDRLADDLADLAGALRDGSLLPPARSIEAELLAMLSTAEAAATRELHAGGLSGMLGPSRAPWPAAAQAAPRPLGLSGPAAAAGQAPLGASDALSLVRGVASRARHVARARQRVAAAWCAAPGEAQVPGVDRAALRGFVSPADWPLATLRGHLRWTSPVLRHALRATLAMGCAYALAHALPWGQHKHWLLLTVAAVMRGNLEQTLMRRNARIVGTLLGCMAAFLLLEFTTAPAVVFVAMALALSLAHAYVLVDYRVTAAAGAVMALLQIHLLSRYTGGLGAGVVVERVIDTVLGAGLAWAFSYVLPSWEREQLPRLVRRLLKAQADYARQVLVWQQPASAERGWRAARREVYDALWLLTQTLQRMAREPQEVRAALHGLETLLVRSYRLITHLAAARTMLTVRADELDAARAQAALREAVQALARQLGAAAQGGEAAGAQPASAAGPATGSASSSTTRAATAAMAAATMKAATPAPTSAAMPVATQGAAQAPTQAPTQVPTQDTTTAATPASPASFAAADAAPGLDDLPRAAGGDPTPWLQRRLGLARQEATLLSRAAQALLRELEAPPRAARR
ncbi:MAG: FUSC family protein [Burkholderiales bacterium]|nr:FUSC family protein [Burkholderiales bacterium]